MWIDGSYVASGLVTRTNTEALPSEMDLITLGLSKIFFYILTFSNFIKTLHHFSTNTYMQNSNSKPVIIPVPHSDSMAATEGS